MSQLTMLKAKAGGWDPFIPVYPGNKRKYRGPIFNSQYEWEAVLEPFCGTGSTALYARADRRFLGEKAPDVRAIWQCWIGGEWDWVRGIVMDKTRRCDGRSKAHVAAVWEWATDCYHAAPNVRPVELAAASLILRKLAFGGVIRHNASGQLNVSWSPHKIPAFLNWDCSAPDAVPGFNINPSWEQAVEKWESSNPGESLVVIDPPYWLLYTPGTQRRGTGLMTPAYAGHRPHDPETLALCLDPLRWVAPIPAASRIVVCNYFSEVLHREVMAVAAATGRQVHWQDFGSMDRMNNGNGEARVKANERLWVLQ